MAKSADDLTIRGLIEFLLKDKGLIDAKGGLKDLGNQADKTEQKLGTLGKGFDALGKKIAAAFAVTAITRFVRTSVTEFAKYERSLNVIIQQMGRLGLHFKGGLSGMKDYFEQLERGSGIARQELAPAFQKFLGITKSVEGAMYLTAQAADLVNSSLGGDIHTNAERLANLLQGDVNEAAKALNLTMRDSNGVVKTQEELLLELREAYGGLGGSLKDSQSDVETLGSTWNSLRQDLGERFAPVLRWVAKLFDVAGRSFIAFVSGLNVIRAAIKDFIHNPFGGPSQEYLRAHVQYTIDLAKVWKKGGEEAGKQFAGSLEEAVRVARLSLLAKDRVAARKLAEESARAAVEVHEQGTRARLAAEIKFLELKRENAVQAALDEGRSIVGIREQFNAQLTALQVAFSDEQLKRDKERALEVMQAELGVLEDGSRAKLKLQLELLEEQRKVERDAAEERGEDLLLVDEKYQLLRLALLKQFSDAQFEQEKEAHAQMLEAKLELERAYGDLDLALTQQGSQEHFAILRRRIEEEREAKLEKLELEYEAERDAAIKRGDDLNEIQRKKERKRVAIEAEAKTQRELLARQELQFKREMQLAVAQAAVQTITALFGESKAAAIAQAVVDTWLAVNNALAQIPYPYSIAVAALVAAQGLANVHKIREADITKEKGFDDPVNDRVAYFGGYRWAQDMMANVTRGFNDSLRVHARVPEGQRVQMVTNRQEGAVTHHTHLHVGTLVADRLSMRKLHRELLKAAKRDRARSLH